MNVSPIARAWFLIIFIIPSVLVGIFTLYHLLKDRVLRNSLNNHVMICLLFFGLLEELTDIIWEIQFYSTQTVPIQTQAFCIFWTASSTSFIISIFWLMAWASIERHILIFYPHWFGTSKKRLLFHYLPLTLCMMWPAVFYSFVFYVRPCDIPFNYNVRFCSRYSCLNTIPWLSLWDSILHFIMPAYLIVIFSVALLVRVLYQRYIIRQRIDWRNYKKLTIQVLPISILYLFLHIPPLSMYVVYSAGLSRTVAADYYSDSVFFGYGIELFTPFVSLGSVPDLKAKFTNLIFFWRKNRTVVPQSIIKSRTPGVQTTAQ